MSAEFFYVYARAVCPSSLPLSRSRSVPDPVLLAPKLISTSSIASQGTMTVVRLPSRLPSGAAPHAQRPFESPSPATVSLSLVFPAGSS